MHVYFFSWIFPACTLLLDTARLFIFDNFPRLHIFYNYFKIWYGSSFILFAAYTFQYLKKTVQKCVNFEMNFLKGNEKSINVCILACKIVFFQNFHHTHFKFFKENSTIHIYFIMHVYYFFPQIPLCMFISSCTFIRCFRVSCPFAK